jgi:NAD(P)-dependent dehydrogenase (short-subunit alcohol dehydrogenase family)
MNGLVTLITGGAAGLGLACAKRFSRQGARVIISDLPSSKGNEIVENWSSIFASSSNSTLHEPEENVIIYFYKKTNFIFYNISFSPN